MTRPERWRPLLEGEAAQEAWAAIRAIGDHLTATEPSCLAPRGRSTPYPGLASGSAGVALFLRYLARALPGEGYDEAATAYLDSAVEALSEWPLLPGLHSGFSGIAWTARHLDGEVDDDGTAELDEVLLAALAPPPPDPEYDLISGAVGLGVYGLEALPGRFGRRCLERVVERLDGLHEATSDGATWFTPPAWVPESQKHIAPHGYYNLGMAHGVPGVIVLLAACRRAGVGGERGERLLRDAVGWLLARRQDPEVGSCFPSWVGEGIEPGPSRLAWCYGDPGVAAALLTAARAAGETAWERAATEILRGAARRELARAGVRDAGLCHGAAGLALVFNRAHQATGEPELDRAARYWYRRTLDMRRPGQGAGGFLSWETSSGGGSELRGETGLLTGASGVGLALLAAVTPVEPAWDRVLGLSVPAGMPAGDGLATASDAAFEDSALSVGPAR